MSDKFQVTILTPERVFVDQQVSMVTLPAFKGEIGILADHIPVIVKMRAGLVRLYEGKSVSKTAFAYGGFAEFFDNKLYILADIIKEISDLNPTDARTRMKGLTNKLLTSLDPVHNEQILEEIHVYRKILEIHG
ncbi:MAG: ATP synthase F1 subunit epsilon [Rickettsiales bacterium]